MNEWCLEEGCVFPPGSKGWCQEHYAEELQRRIIVKRETQRLADEAKQQAADEPKPVKSQPKRRPPKPKPVRAVSPVQVIKPARKPRPRKGPKQKLPKLPCVIEGCPRYSRSVRVQRECNTHYMRQFRTGTTELQDSKPKVCTVPDCTNPHKALGLCVWHYERQRRAKTRPPVTPRLKEQCASPACDRIAKVKGLCGTHYERQRTGRPIDTPIHHYTP